MPTPEDEIEHLAEQCSTLLRENERLRAALETIAKMKPEPIAEGFVHGPTLLLSNCQRIAREALRRPRRADGD